MRNPEAQVAKQLFIDVLKYVTNKQIAISCILNLPIGTANFEKTSLKGKENCKCYKYVGNIIKTLKGDFKCY